MTSPRYCYLATLSRSNSVFHAVKSYFTNRMVPNLILNKHRRLEIYTYLDVEYGRQQGQEARTLELTLELPVHGNVVFMGNVPCDDRDYLLLVTHQYEFFVLKYNVLESQVDAIAAGTLKDRIGRALDSGMKVIIHPKGTYIIFLTVPGILKLYPLDSDYDGSLIVKPGFNIRIDMLAIVDICGLWSKNEPEIGVIYLDTNDAPYFKSYIVDLEKRELVDCSLNSLPLDSGSKLLIPVSRPYGGAVIVSPSSILYVSGTFQTKIGHVCVDPKCFDVIDPLKYLFSDKCGEIFIVCLLLDDLQCIGALMVQKLGVTVLPECLCYLEDSHVFVGSTLGSSQLVQLSEKRAGVDAGIDLLLYTLDEFYSTGPIVDFVSVDLYGCGAQLVLCCGAFKEGSLAIMRSGIELADCSFVEFSSGKDLAQAGASSQNVPVYSISNIWNVSNQDDKSTTLAIRTWDKCVLIREENTGWNLHHLSGWCEDEDTIFCGSVAHSQILQVTSNGLILIGPDGSARRFSCKDFDQEVEGFNMVSLENPYLITTSGCKLLFFEIHKGDVVLISKNTFTDYISCVDIFCDGNLFAAVGFWNTNTLWIVSLPDFGISDCVAIDNTSAPITYICICLLGPYAYVFASMGDGCLCIYKVEQMKLVPDDVLKFGHAAAKLYRFHHRSTEHSNLLFVLSNRPSVFYMSRNGPRFSPINTQNTTSMALFVRNEMECVDGKSTVSMALSCEDGLVFGNLDLTFRKKPYVARVLLDGNEMPRRIEYQETSRTIGIITVARCISGPSHEDRSYLRILDPETLGTLDVYQFERGELAHCITSTVLEKTKKIYYVVGVSAFQFITDPLCNNEIEGSIENPDVEDEPSAGAIYVFEVIGSGKTLVLVDKIITSGAIYTMCAYNGRLVASVRNKVLVYELQYSTDKWMLVSICSQYGQILPLCMYVVGTELVVGDIMRSFSVLRMSDTPKSMDEVARDYHSQWITAVHAFEGKVPEENIYIGAEGELNIYLAKRCAGAKNEIEKKTLELVGAFHLGEVVNKFRPGTLAPKNVISGAFFEQSAIFCTTNGTLGFLGSITEKQYVFLDQLQVNISKVVRDVCGQCHAKYRNYQSTTKSIKTGGFIDGDMIELCMELPQYVLEKIVNGEDGGTPLGATVKELIDTISKYMYAH